MREELMRCGSLAVSDRVDGCVPKARADQIRRIVYRTCWPEEAERSVNLGRFQRLLRAAEACEAAWDENLKADEGDG